jgi:hypothetical protein
MSTAPKHHRRWFQFSLGTMFVVVALAAIGLAWQINVVHQRKIVLNWIEENGGNTYEKGVDSPEARTASTPVYVNHAWVSEDLRMPAWRRWLGDRPFFFLVVPEESSDEDIRRVRAAFPEPRAIHRVVVERPEWNGNGM